MPIVLTEIKLRDNNRAENIKLGPMNTFFHFHIDLENFQRFQQSAKATQNDPTLLKKIGLALQYKSYLNRAVSVRSILDESENGCTLLLELKNPNVIEVCKITFNPKKDGELIKRLNSPDYLKNIEVSTSQHDGNLKPVETQDIDESIFERNTLGVDIYPARFGKIPRTPKRNSNKKELDKEEREDAIELFSSYHAEIILPLLEQQNRLKELFEKVEINKKLSLQMEEEIVNIGLIPDEECESAEEIDKIFNIEAEADLREQQITDLDSVRNNLQQRKNLDDDNDQSKAGLLQQAESVLAHNYSIFQSTDACFKEIRAELVQVLHDTALQYFYSLLKGYKNELSVDEANKFNKKFENIAEITFDHLNVGRNVGPNVIEYQNKAIPKLNIKNLSLKNPETLEIYIQNFLNVSKYFQGRFTWSTVLRLFKENFEKHPSLHQYCAYKPYKFTWTNQIIANLNKHYPCSHEQLKSKVLKNKEFIDALEQKIQAAYDHATLAKNKITPIIERIKAKAEKLKNIKANAKAISQNLNRELEKLISTRDQLLKTIISLNNIEDIDEKDCVKNEDIKKLEKESNDKLAPIKAIALDLEQINSEIQSLTSIQKTEELYGRMLGLFNEVNLRLSFRRLNKVANYLTNKHEEAAKARLAAEQVERDRLAAEQAQRERLAAEQVERERLAAEKAKGERLAAEKAEGERLAAEAERERLAAEQIAIEKERQSNVIDFAKKIDCLLNQVNDWSKEVRYLGGEKLEGTNLKVQRSIKAMHDSKKNISLNTYEEATAFINRNKEIVDNAGDGYSCCIFKTRTTKTAQFYQLIELFDFNNPKNQNSNHKFKQINSNWDTVWETYNSKKNAGEESTVLVTDVDSTPSTPRSLSRASSVSS